MAGRKMAKSAGNFQRVTELVERGIDPLAFRYLVLTSRYGHKLDYSDESIDGRRRRARVAADAARARSGRHPPTGRGRRPARSGRARPATGRWGSRDGVAGHGGGDGYVRPRDRAHAPAAPAVGRGSRRSTTGSWPPSTTTSTCRPPWSCVREILRSDLPADERRWLVLDADASSASTCTGSGPPTHPMRMPSRPPYQGLVAERAAARATRDFGRADALRAEIEAAGWEARGFAVWLHRPAPGVVA